MPRISIRIAIFAAMLVAMAITAIIAFIPTHQAGLDSVNDSITMVRANVLGRVVNGVELFFKVPAAQVDSIQVAWESGTLQLNNDEQIINMLCGLLAKNRDILTGNFLYSTTSVHGCDQRFGVPLVGAVHLPNINFEAFTYDFSTMNYTQPKNKMIDIPWNATIQWGFFVDRIFSNNDHWLDASEGYNAVTFGATVPLVNRVTGVMDTRLLAYLHPPQLVELLNGLGIGANGKVLLADGNTQYVFGNSWGEATEQLYANWGDLTLDGDQRMKMKRISDFNEPTVQRVVSGLGGEPGFYAIPNNLSTTMFEGEDKVFVDITTLRDSHELNVKILVVLVERDFTQTIVDRQKTTIGGVCGALAMMLILSIIFAILLTRPLHRLGYRMHLTASLQDEGEDDAPSALSEIAEMQVAYVAMKNELLRMKSYLPQSVLAGLEDDDEDEGSIDESHQNSVSQTPQTQSIQGTSSQRSSKNNVSHSARSSSSASHLGVAAGALNLARNVHRRRVAMTCINLVGFHKVSQQGSTAPMTNLQAKYLTICGKHIRDNKGYVDHFHGDHVFASFNAVTTVASPGKRAVLAAIAAAKELSDTQLMPKVSAGVAVGQAAAGNMGNESMVRFNVVGGVYTQCYAMERIARQRLLDSSSSEEATPKGTGPLRCADNTLIAMTHDATNDVELEIESQIFDIMTIGGIPRLVAFAGNVRQMASDEWMYQLENAQKDDGNQAANTAFRALMDGDFDAARKVVDGVAGERSAALARVAELCQGSDLSTSASKLVLDF